MRFDARDMEQGAGECFIVGNAEKNRHVRRAITSALLELLRERSLSEISVSEIASRAQVGRVSFYRNYKTKEDVVRECVHEIVHAWAEREQLEGAPPDKIIKALFLHVAANRGLYTLLRERGLFHLFRDALKQTVSRGEDLTNVAAYATAFVTYGLYGWVEEWLARGMWESPSEIYEMLKAQSLMGPR